MQARVRKKLRYIGDGERLFRKWASWGKAGTIKLLAKWVGDELGLKNPKTGKNPSEMGVWSKMWRWALRNPDEARKIYADYVLELDGDLLDDEEWNSLLYFRAKQLLTAAGRRKYVKKYPQLEKYV